MKSWAVPVPLFPNELFSSWLTRAALIQGCDPLELTRQAWPRWRVWAIDVDRGVGSDRLRPLSQMSGIPADAFEDAMLWPTAQLVGGPSIANRAVWPWMLTLGTRNRRRRGGLQYCPACLGNAPFYLREWRFAWHVACRQHGCNLLDRCQHCDAPLEPHRLVAGDDHAAKCATCKADLRTMSVCSGDAGAMTLQTLADEVLSKGQATYGADSLNTTDWFALVRWFVAIVRSIGNHRSARLDKLAQALAIDADNVETSTGLAFEFLPIQERVALLSAAGKLLSIGPEAFVQSARDATLTVNSLPKPNVGRPPCVQQIMHMLPQSPVVRRRHNPTSRPRSRRSVLRMWARLQRRHSGR